jgi:hypothetical protein
MTVKARLEGHVFDLETLAELFGQGEPRVVKHEDGFYYLTSEELDGLMDNGGRLMEVGTAVLRHVAGVARALDGSFRPVTLSGYFISSNGDERRHHVVAAGTAEVRGRAQIVAVATTGSESELAPPPPPLGPPYVNLTKDQPDVAEVLEILGKSDTSIGWIDLYKVYEVLRHNVGGDTALKAKSWTSEPELRAFTGSANRPDVSGSEARHARMSGGLPKRAMTLSEGQDFIRRLVVAWWDTLSKEP